MNLIWELGDRESEKRVLFEFNVYVGGGCECGLLKVIHELLIVLSVYPLCPVFLLVLPRENSED